jgi:hypothetical protein
VDEVAIQRLRKAEEQPAQYFKEPDPDRIPIEAPRAPRSNSDLSISESGGLLACDVWVVKRCLALDVV